LTAVIIPVIVSPRFPVHAIVTTSPGEKAPIWLTFHTVTPRVRGMVLVPTTPRYVKGGEELDDTDILELTEDETRGDEDEPGHTSTIVVLLVSIDALHVCKQTFVSAGLSENHMIHATDNAKRMPNSSVKIIVCVE
jgi:hypothetical protein